MNGSQQKGSGIYKLMEHTLNKALYIILPDLTYFLEIFVRLVHIIGLLDETSERKKTWSWLAYSQ